MTIASLSFLGFAAAFALLYNLARPLWWRELVFLAANLVADLLYAWLDPRLSR